MDLRPPKIFNINIWYIVIYFLVIFVIVFVVVILKELVYRMSLLNKSVSRKKIRKNLTDEELLKADIDTLSGTDFERLIEMYYKDQGYQVQRVGGSGDHEVDLILKGKEGYKIAVQCKRWKGNVGNDIVLRLKSGKQIYGCYDAWIITTGYFTKAAQEAAERLNIKLINGIAIKDKLNRWRKNKVKQLKG